MGSDHVRLNDIVLFAHLGVTPAEREVGQRIHIDVDLQLDVSRASQSDALADTIDYEALYRRIEALVEGSRFKLLEALGGHLLRHLLDEFPARSIRLRMRKPNVPFAASLASAEVEMERSR